MEGLAWQTLSTTWDYLRQTAKIECNEYTCTDWHVLSGDSSCPVTPSHLA